MTAHANAPDTGNPLYAEAIALLASGRVVLRAARLGKVSAPGPEAVEGYVIIDGDSLARCDVHMRRDGTWGCDDHPDDEPCAHRFAAQIVTGYAHLGGRSRFDATAERRGIDELPDDELDEAIAIASGYVFGEGVGIAVSPEARAQARRLYDAIAARLRRDGPADSGGES